MTRELWETGLVWGVGLLLKGALLLLVVLLLAAALRRASAGVRHLVWGGGVLALLILPVLTLAVPWRLEVVPRVAPMVVAAPAAVGVTGAAPQPSQPGAAAGEAVAGGASREAAGAPAPAAGGPTASGVSLRALAPWALALWGVVSALLLARLALGGFLLRRVVRRATTLDSPDWSRPLIEAADRMEMEELPRLVITDRVPMPMVCGLVRPAIVMPAAAAEWADGRRRAVLCHELAHLLRRDLLVNLLGKVACAFHWFNPLAWLAAWRLRIESERACDDLVLGVGTRPSEYADHLLQIVCAASRARTPAVALPMAERRVFEGRMLAILEKDVRRAGPSLRQVAAVTAIAVAVAMPVAAMGPARAGVPGDVPEAATATDTVVPAPAAGRTAPDPGAVAQAGRPQGRSDPSPSSREVLQEVVREDLAEPAEEADGQRSDTQIVAALVRVLADSVASVREDAAYALGQLEDRAAAAALATVVRRDRVADVRQMAAWALGQIESRDGTAALLDALRGDASPDVRLMAVWALGQIEDPAAAPVLAELLPRAEQGIRIRIIWALGQIEPSRAPAQLLEALGDPVAEVRVRAAWALGQIEDASAVPALTALLRDRVSEVRLAAIWALGHLETDASRQALAGLLDDPDPNVRARALRAIGGSAEPWPWPWPMPMVR